MTKHLGAAKVQANVTALNMTFLDGRASKASQLHHVTRTDGHETRAARHGKLLWQAMEDRFTDQKGGDHWTSRGVDGIWSRLHLKPRRSLFTPFKVAKGPKSNDQLGVVRFTRGVTKSGQIFEFHDKWNIEKNAHRLLDEPWVGITKFTESDKVSLCEAQSRLRAGRPKDKEMTPAALKWAELWKVRERASDGRQAMLM